MTWLVLLVFWVLVAPGVAVYWSRMYRTVPTVEAHERWQRPLRLVDEVER